MIGNGKLQNTVTGAYTPTFDKEPKFSYVLFIKYKIKSILEFVFIVELFLILF